jgi:hypothetical protein
MIIVRTTDDVRIEFDESKSHVLESCVDLSDPVCEIPVALPSSAVGHLVKWMHRTDDPDEPWNDLLDMARAADYLDMPDLLDRTCRQMALVLKGKSAEQIRTMLGIKITPESTAWSTRS